MAFEQKFKIWLASFNPLWFAGSLSDAPSGYDSLSSYEGFSPSGYSSGDDEVLLSGYGSGMELVESGLIRFAGHDKIYEVDSWNATTGLATLTEPLIQDVGIGEEVYLQHWTDITDLDMDVSDWEKEIETDNYEFIFDSQIRLKTANYNNELYDRTAYKTAFDTAQAFFNTRNENDSERDNKYIRIEAYYNSVWNQIYAGKITPDDMVLDVANHELSFECESALFSLKDIYFQQVEQIRQGHKYTDADSETQTESGKVIDIIWKMFREIGIQPQTYEYTAASVDKDLGIIWFEFASAPDIQVGELIIVNHDPLDPQQFTNNTSYIVTKVDDDYVEAVCKKLHPMYSNTGTITATRVLFDVDYSRYYQCTQYNWTYDITDCWMIPQLWHKKLLADKTCDDIMRMFCGWFISFVTIEYKDGVPFGYFRSKINNSTSKLTLTKNDFIGDFKLKQNWNKYNPSVVASGSITYHDSQIDEGAKSKYVSGGSTYDTKINIRGIEKGETEISTTNEFLPVNSIIKIQNHSDDYRIIENLGSGDYLLSKPLSRSTRYGDAIWLSDSNEIDVEMPELLYTKLIYPHVYCPDDKIVDFTQYISLLYNDGEAVYGYADYQPTNTYLDILGLDNLGTGIAHIPVTPMGIPLSGQLLFVNTYGGDDGIDHGNATRRFYQNEYETWEEDLEGINGVTFGYVETFDDDNAEFVVNACAYIANMDYDEMEEEYTAYLIRNFLDLIDGGDYSTASGDHTLEYKYERFGLYKYSERSGKRKQKAIISDTYINGLYLHSDILKVGKDDYLYFTQDDNGLKKILCFGDDTVDDVFSSGTPATEKGNVHVGNNENAGYTDLIYWVDKDNEKVYRAALGESVCVPDEVAGGGATVLTAGDTCSPADVEFDGIIGVWKCYDDIVIVTDSTGVYLIDDSTTADAIAYKIYDSEDMTKGMCAVDFIQTTYDQYDVFENVALNAISFYGKRRRVINCELDWEEYAEYELNIGDVITMESDIVNTNGNNVNFWVDKINLDFKERILKLRLLEC